MCQFGYMDDRTATLMASIAKTADKREASRRKRRSKRKRSNPQAELHVEWSTEFRELYGKDVEVPGWGPAERSLAKKLIGEIGFDKALAMVRHFVRTWPKRTFEGVPGMKLMWTMRQRMLAEMSGSVSVSAKRDRLLNDEWSDDSADGPSEGWG